jgi:thiamine biosynthesis lipoprotein ApbE
MGPIAQSDGHDRPRLIDELVPGVAAMLDIAGSATVADGLSTAFSIMPIDRVRACARSLESVSVYFVLKDRSIVNVTF